MRAPRITIAGMVLAITIVALDCAAMRLVLTRESWPPSLSPITIIAAIPVVDALAVGLALLVARRRRDGRSQPFLVGFEACGLVALLAFAIAMAWRSEAILEAIRPVIRPFFAWLMQETRLGRHGAVDEVVGFCIEIGAIFAVFSTPQLLFALIGGGIARRVWGRGSEPVAAES